MFLGRGLRGRSRTDSGHRIPVIVFAFVILAESDANFSQAAAAIVNGGDAVSAAAERKAVPPVPQLNPGKSCKSDLQPREILNSLLPSHDVLILRGCRIILLLLL